MSFNTKRYFYGAVKRKRVGLFFFIIPVLFLVFSAVFPDRYIVSQNILIKDTAHIAHMTEPVGHMTFRQIVDDPSLLFINQYSLTRISNDILKSWSEHVGPDFVSEIRDTMGLKRLNDDTAMVFYKGKSREAGIALVEFYSDRLLKKAIEGSNRSGIQGSDEKAVLSGEIKINEIRAFWRLDRLVPFLYCLLLSFVLVALIFGFLEWTDNALKSERQIARYCNLPILGNIPNFNRVAQKMQEKRKV